MEFLSRVEDELRCPHCRQLFVDAVLLPCSHSICLQCAVGLAASNPSCHRKSGISSSRPTSAAVYSLTSISTVADVCDPGFEHPSGTMIPSTFTSPSSIDTVNCEVDRASVGSETDSGVVCTSSGGTSASSSGASPCNGSAASASRPNSYVGTDSVGNTVGNTSVGNLSTISGQNSSLMQGVGHQLVDGKCSTGSDGGFFEINCPCCRRSVAVVDEPTPVALLSVLHRNRSLEAIVDRYRETRHLAIRCQRCFGDCSINGDEEKEGDEEEESRCSVAAATVVCEQCVAFFCERCYEREHGGVTVESMTGSYRPVAEGHTPMRPVVKGKAWLAAVSRGRSVSCSYHDDETLSIYCVTCGVSICCLCSSGEHSTHATKPIGTMAKSHKIDLSQLLHTLSEKVKASTEALQKLKSLQDRIDGNSSELESAVVRQCDLLIDAIERRKAVLLSNIREHRAKKHQQFTEQMSELSCRLHRHTGLLQFGIETLKDTDASAFLLTSSSLMTRINGVIDALDYELQLEPRVTPQLELSLDTEPASLAIEAMELYEMKVPRQPTILVDACIVENNVITVAWLDHVTGVHDNIYILELDDGNEGHFRVAYFSLDPATAHQDVLFSNDNMTVTSSSFDDRVVLGSVGLSRGVHYWEISIDRYENNKDPAFGIALQSVARDRMIGKDESGWSMYIDNCRSWFMTAGRHSDRTAGGITVGSVVGVQLDLNRRTLSFFVNGESQGGVAHCQLPNGAVFYPAISLNRNVQMTLISGLPPITTVAD